MKILARSIILAATIGISSTLLAQKPLATDECAKIAGMQVYSSTLVDKETGDLQGYDLAIKRDADSGVDALLYVYEGQQIGDGIPLSGKISNNQLSVQGTWVEHLIEYPSKKETVQEHFVKIVGIFGSAGFRSELTIGDMAEREQVRLKRVKRIWSCKSWTRPSKTRVGVKSLIR